MIDKNGVAMKTGDLVVITGGFFKADNGCFVVTHSPGDENWCGRDHALCRCSKKGKMSIGKYRTAFWPLMVTINDHWKRLEAKAWNEENAQIEVVGHVDVKPEW